MKKAFWMLSVAMFALLAACSMKVASSARRTANGPLIVRAHFVGTEQLFAAPDAAKLKEAWSAPATAGFRNEVLNRAALLPSFWLGGVLPKGAATQTNLFRPLLDDVLTRESYIDCTAAPDFFLAVKVTDERARLWQTNLWQALANWKLGSPAAVKGDASGFEVKHAAVPGMFRCLRAGEWIVVSASNGKSGREAELLANIKSLGRPAKATGAWLDGEANLARFDGWLPALANFENLPIAHFSFSNRADFVRTYATLDFGKPHGWKPEPWQMPTNFIRDPLISFVAARGVAPIFDAFKSWRDLGYQPTPNQIFGWGYNTLPFQFNYVTPSRDVRAQLKKIHPKLAAQVIGQEPNRRRGSLDWTTNEQRIVWRDLPFAVPHLGAMRDSGHEYLMLDCYLPVRSTNATPPELLSVLQGRNDLAAFDFEITAERIPHWRQFYHLADIATQRVITPTNAPFSKWLIETAPKLGESVTELRSTSPTQMTFVRKSTTGLTAFEILTLGRWLESTNFPAFGVFPAQPAVRVPGRGASAGK